MFSCVLNVLLLCKHVSERKGPIHCRHIYRLMEAGTLNQSTIVLSVIEFS